jgi:hypothetical protein
MMPLIRKDLYGDYEEQMFEISWGCPQGSRKVSLELRDGEQFEQAFRSGLFQGRDICLGDTESCSDTRSWI